MYNIRMINIRTNESSESPCAYSYDLRSQNFGSRIQGSCMYNAESVEDVTSGIHMETQYGHSDRGTPGRPLQTDYTRTTCRARLHEASIGIGIESSLP